MKILVVSEGKHELNLDDGEPTNGPLVRLVARVLRSRGISPLEFERRAVKDLPPGMGVRGKAANYQHRARAWIHKAQIDGFDAIVLLVDQDRNPDRRIGLDAAQAETRLHLPRAIGLAVESFDAWMLADEQAISKATEKTVFRQKNPETIKDSKAVLHALIETLGETRTTMYLLIAEHSNLETLIERCPEGFAPFHARLTQLSEQHHPAHH